METSFTKKTFYYVIVLKKTGKMFLQDCKAPIYWSPKIAQNRCSFFPGCVVIKISAERFNKLIEDSFITDTP